MAANRQASRKSLVESAREVVQGSAGLRVRTAERRISGFLEERLRGTGLSLAQFGLMAQIAAARDDSIGALAERSGLDQSTLSRNLRALERAGWVEITVHEADQRRRAAWLTEAGARRLESAMPVWHAAHRALTEELGPRVVRLVAELDRLLARPARVPRAAKGDAGGG